MERGCVFCGSVRAQRWELGNLLTLVLCRNIIGRSREVVNKTLQWQTHKNRYGGLGEKIPLQEGFGAVVTAFSDKQHDQDSTHRHINRANTLTCIPYTDFQTEKMGKPQNKM